MPIDTFGGGSVVVDYRGQIVGRHNYSAGSSWVAGTVDIEALRRFRANAQWDNWIKDLTTEQYQLIYEQPVYPKNLYLDRAPVPARRVPARGDRQAGRTHARTGHLGAARQ